MAQQHRVVLHLSLNPMDAINRRNLVVKLRLYAPRRAPLTPPSSLSALQHRIV